VALALALLAVMPATGASKAKPRGLDPDKRLSQHRLDVWHTEHGLPPPSVYSLAQTPDGFLSISRCATPPPRSAWRATWPRWRGPSRSRS
jgi:hypothetical protein